MKTVTAANPLQHESLWCQMFCPDRAKCFIDVLDAQWECEGELIPLDTSVLNPREFLVYQHGLFLTHTLHSLKLVGAAASLLFSTLLLIHFLNCFHCLILRLCLALSYF